MGAGVVGCVARCIGSGVVIGVVGVAPVGGMRRSVVSW